MKRMRWVFALALALPSAAGAQGFSDVPEGHWAKDAIAKVAAKGVMPAKAGGKFAPDQAVTRAELAGILVRLIDHIETSGPKKLTASPAKPHVPKKQRAALAKLPRNHPAYPAVARLIQGGYLIPDIHGDAFLPTAATLNQPVTPEELARALAGISIRLTEKRVAIDHPDSLKEGYRLGPNEERRVVPHGQQHRHDDARPARP